MRPCAAWSLLLAVLMGLCSSAAAQDRWTFVPVTVAGRPAANPQLVEVALDDPRVLSNSAAATTMEARHSSDARHLSDQEMERALALVHAVKDSLRNEDKGALKQQRELEHLAAPLQDFLRRDTRRQEDLANACVLAGGLLLRLHKSKDAQEQLRSCARIYPGRKPQASPEIVNAYNQAEAEVAAEPHGSLDVEGGAGCGVRVNGALLGTSPLHIDTVRVGTARIQLECGGPGRIHGVDIAPGANQVRIDPEFERALSTSGSQLLLTYADEEQRERSMARDGQRLSEILGAHVVLLVPLGSAASRLVSLQPPAELGTLTAGAPPPTVIKKVRALMGPVSPPPAAPPHASATMPTLPEPDTPPPVEELVTRPVPHRSAANSGGDTARVVVAGSLVAAGLAGVVTAWVLYAARVDRRTTARLPMQYRDVIGYHNLGNAALWIATGSGLLLTGAEYLLLPRENGVPTSAWAWFGGGFLVAASGVALMAAENHCSTPSVNCRGFGADSTLGPLLILHAIPLLSVPLNYAIADWLRPKRRIELGLHGSEATFTYRF